MAMRKKLLNSQLQMQIQNKKLSILQLCEACKDGDVRKVQRILPKLDDVNFLDPEDQMDPLHLAVLYHPNKVNLVQILVWKGADVNSICGIRQRTCLDIAATEDCDKTVEFLLKQGANLKLLDNYGNTALINAVQARKYTNYKDKTIDENFCTRTIELLLSCGKNLKCKTDIDQILKKIYQLNEHIIKGDKKAIQKWLDKTFLNFQAFAKEPLCLAYLLNQLDLVDILEKKGAVRPTSLLHDVIEFHDQELLKQILIRNSRDINEVFCKYTALQHAVTFSLSSDLIETLLTYGARANDQIKEGEFSNLEGKTAFHVVMMNDDDLIEEQVRKIRMADIIKTLLKYNADPNIQDALGRTPLHLACLNGNVECIKILVEGQADLHIKDFEGRNVIHFAASNKEEPEILRYLLGFDTLNVNLKDSKNKLPFDYAESKEIALMLKEKMYNLSSLEERDK